MNNIETMATFFGWCAVINIGVQLVTAILVLGLRDFISGIHAKMFGVEETFARQLYLEYLSHFKILVIVFTIVPYFALKIMGG